MRTSAVKPRGWGSLARTGVLLLAVAVLGVFLARGEVTAAELGPLEGAFEPEVEIELSDDESDVNADLTTSFVVPVDHYNYESFVSFTPVEFFPGADVPVAAKAGTLSATATLGLLNGPCNTALPPVFELWWASTDTSDTITFEEQYENDPSACNHDGIYHYPDFINRIVEDTFGPGIQPAERMYGYANVGGNDVTINFVVFEAGSLPGFPAALGRPSVTFLNDIGDPASVPLPGQPITAFCAPLSTDITIYGLSQDNPCTDDNEAGSEVRANPSCGGPYTFRWHAQSMIDAEDDGIENYNDTCPYDANLGDFRAGWAKGTGDGDAGECGMDSEAFPGDGIDCACDPDPNLPGTLPAEKVCWPGAPGPMDDCDDDGFQNRSDNCPLDANPDQADVDTDSIGDECDDNPNTPDGDSIVVDLEQEVDIEGPDCAADSDEDTFLDGVEIQLGSCPWDPCTEHEFAPGQNFCPGVEAATSTPEDQSESGSCTDGLDNDGDGYVDGHDGGCADDTDNDGASDDAEDEFESDFEDAGSTPEDASVACSCTDGVDNDGDGLTDAEDPACAVEATPTPTPAPEGKTRLPEGASAGDTEIVVEDTTGFAVGDTIEIGSGETAEICTITAISDSTLTLDCTLKYDHAADEPVTKIVAPTPTPAIEVEFCPPAIPGTYHGRVDIDGKPAGDGYELTASIDDPETGSAIQWGSAIVSGGRYAMDIPDHLPSEEPCFQGGTITFELNGMTCTPEEEGADEFAAGLQNVDLNCVSPATPVATPTAPPATPTVTATPAPATPTATPAKPPVTGAGGLADSGHGLPVWAMALASWVGLMAVAGLGTLVAVKRR